MSLTQRALLTWLATSLCLASMASADDTAKTQPVSQEALSSAYNELMTEAPYYLVKSSTCQATAKPNLDADTVCKRRTLGELLTWSLGMECDGQAADTYVAQLGMLISEKLASRKRILGVFEAASPEDQNKMAHRHTDFAEYKDGLKRYVETQKLFSPLERVLLYSYFQNGFIYINGVLRAGGQAADCAKPLVEAQLDALDKLGRYRGTVWRGAQLPRAVLDKYLAGETLAWPAFSSTSLDSHVADLFSHRTHDGDESVIFEISSRNCFDARGASERLNEQEVLCPPGTKVKVVSHKMTPFPPTHHHIVLDEVL